tara:strand:- start:1388 stop:1672 length:285 start_codon:yes stop_codon:yes gene_type:complete
MKVKDMLGQIEKLFGRVPEKYMLALINDGLEEIGITKQHKRDDMKTDLIENQRWYPLDDKVIDIVRVEIKDTNDRYVMIPKLSDPHKLLKEDEY